VRDLLLHDLRRRILSGTYLVDSARVADALLGRALARQSASP
jgi:anti-sigma28 factor (negative regulator of flagellin synthesis)